MWRDKMCEYMQKGMVNECTQILMKYLSVLHYCVSRYLVSLLACIVKTICKREVIVCYFITSYV
jgi:hypothetical protein